MRLSPRVLGLALALVGCFASDPVDGHPSAREAAREVGLALCPHVRSCAPEHYAARFPSDVQDGSIDACLAAMLDGVPIGRADVCDQGRIDACVADTRAKACGAPEPESCRGC